MPECGFGLAGLSMCVPICCLPRLAQTGVHMLACAAWIMHLWVCVCCSDYHVCCSAAAGTDRGARVGVRSFDHALVGVCQTVSM